MKTSLHSGRTYTLKEIDQMRDDMFAMAFGFNEGMSPDFDRTSRHIEDELRTYMQAGIDPKDISAKREAMRDAAKAARAKETIVR